MALSKRKKKIKCLPFREIDADIFTDYMLSEICFKIIRRMEVSGDIDRTRSPCLIIVEAGWRVHLSSFYSLLWFGTVHCKKLKQSPCLNFCCILSEMLKAVWTYVTGLVGRTTVHRGRMGGTLLRRSPFQECNLFEDDPQAVHVADT